MEGRSACGHQIWASMMTLMPVLTQLKYGQYSFEGCVYINPLFKSLPVVPLAIDHSEDRRLFQLSAVPILRNIIFVISEESIDSKTNLKCSPML